jgi:hypothetical protein
MQLDAAIGHLFHLYRPGGHHVIGHGIGGKDIPIMARLAKGKMLE